MNSRPTQEPSSTDNSPEVTCSKCGEHVRVGVVRCWNCQAFMHPDIEAKYHEMLSEDRPVIYSDVEDMDDAPVAVTSPSQHSVSDDAEADFTLDDDVALYAEDGDFELSEDVKEKVLSATPPPEAGEEPKDPKPQTENANSTEEPESDESYSIAQPADVADGENSPSKDESPKSEKSKADDSGEDHSVATGGEALWEIAKQEATKPSRNRTRKTTKVKPGSILVFCPNGHRIEVQERHRGRMGRCPKCKSQFTVPIDHSVASASSEQAEESSADTMPEFYFIDLHLHSVEPEKLKLKEGSLAKTFENIDVCLSEEGILLISAGGKGGLFGGGMKPEEFRKEMFEFLALKKPLKKAPGENNYFIDPDELKKIAVVHPTAYAHESILGGIDVFGPGKIALRLPKRDEKKLEFLVLTLSQFRKLLTQMKEQCGMDLEFEADQIPVEDKTTPSLCHYTDEPMKYLKDLIFYENDPEMELELLGWKCQACGLTVSEDGRKKEKIGGKTGKGIAKAKCPKCNNPFGKNPLYGLKKAPEPVAEEELAAEE